jgi:hypothetical protein
MNIIDVSAFAECLTLSDKVFGTIFITLCVGAVLLMVFGPQTDITADEDKSGDDGPH